MTQSSLFTTAKAPRVTEAEVMWMLHWLNGHGWMTHHQFMRGGYLDGERRLRAIRQASHGRIISGQKGYCRIEEATVAEAQHSIAWKIHQAAEMLVGARAEEQALHQCQSQRRTA